MASAPRCPALCCCRRSLHPGPGSDSPQPFQPGPPDPASASSFQLYRLHHFHLGLELRPESRELSGCLVLELSCLVPGGPALVLDIHPVVRVSSVRCRRGGRPSRSHTDRPFPWTSQSCPPRDHSAQRNCPARDPPGDQSWNPEDSTHGCQEECKPDLGLSDSPSSPQTTVPSYYATPESSTASPDTAEGTPQPLDLSISHLKSSTSLPHVVPGDFSCGPDNSAVSAAGTGCPTMNGHQHLTSLNSCVSTLAPFTSTSSPTADLSSHSSSSCYTWSLDSLGSPTPDSGFATSSIPALFSSMDIPALEALPCTFSQPCEFHVASDSVPAHSTCCFPLDFRVEEFSDYGSALAITVPETLRTNETFQVIVHYVTGEGPAVWWLDPELSYGSSELFVFTQGHSVCNRSFFPCFDTPAVKCTYSASVKAPAGIRVLMSCTHSYYIEEMGIFHFYMEHPVPAYLVALTAGHLLPADIGPRSRVWAEPCVLPLAVGKLAGQVEQWLQAAESLYGPYIWGRYDIVFLPPSFPIVAMENPCLTFVICSILDSEDFLLIDVIHEIAHGWFGNAVTNASWEEMWLSEGLATYAQRRITTLVYGAAFTCLETTFRLEALHRQIRILGQDTPFSRLQAKLDTGVNPSNLMNLFTYEKGFCFVHYLSQLCGDQDNFDAFLRDYIEKFKFRSVVANDLLESYLSFFPHLRDESQLCSEGLDFERWLNAPGPPLTQPDLSQGSVFTSSVEELNRLWMAEPLDIEAAVTFVNIAKWRTFQTVLFLDKLLDQSPLRPEVMLQLSLCYSSDLATMNTEIRIRWLQIVVRNNFQPDLPRVRHFLLCQTSRMYTIPLYEDLSAGPLKSCALEIFCQTHGRLHPNLRKTIQQILAQGGSVMQPDSSLPALSTELCTQGSSSLRDVNVTA
ncbi:PREDICTED: arginyl aminopeptidase-like 1 [Nanorana parkeri]|uniref:arginyl aminopeptidase-like 1 n=1 Tax=Nanorana parkeri TaxID=125878 RepID=UPI000854BF64|nr:PREDICTED: arginyl aminopeptidase-like 1 [Nanorana parkeri]